MVAAVNLPLIDRAFILHRKAHGQEGAVRGYPLGLASNGSLISFQNTLFSPRLSRNPCIIGQIAYSVVVHFVTLTFVFMHIVGSIFIFNIFMGQRPVPDLDQRVGEPPQLAQAGIFHSLHEHRVFVVRSHQDGVILE